MNEDRRRAIVAELAALARTDRTMEPWMFTVMDLATEMDWPRARTEKWLRAQVAHGRMRMDLDGYDPRTGRKAALYWRVEDESQAETAERREGEPSEELA